QPAPPVPEPAYQPAPPAPEPAYQPAPPAPEPAYQEPLPVPEPSLLENPPSIIEVSQLTRCPHCGKPFRETQIELKRAGMRIMCHSCLKMI
ncbi:MAG: hypothetical protein HWN65_08565, partial [Candidatus Helarchaeota archaeon]|nr:hypothetical protein [Candidatus Helarchaeota archaeon]